jgi:hypothetical protein
MSNLKFDPQKDSAPIPFNQEICQFALEMNRSGLVWRPHVGCFVWDPDKVIKQTSPFPNRIYFLLSMTRFLEIFGTKMKMVENLVWLPTWRQARSICRQLEISDSVIADLFQQDAIVDEDLKEIYRCIRSALKEQAGK